ncbi:MAG: hypothetical protein JST22_09700 [Bacteroidetes bacterium]|nr:hypothetical protein [Bacteroidota bacterium]
MNSGAEGASISPENHSQWFMRTERPGFGIWKMDGFELASGLWAVRV